VGEKPDFELRSRQTLRGRGGATKWLNLEKISGGFSLPSRGGKNPLKRKARALIRALGATYRKATFPTNTEFISTKMEYIKLGKGGGLKHHNEKLCSACWKGQSGFERPSQKVWAKSWAKKEMVRLRWAKCASCSLRSFPTPGLQQTSFATRDGGPPGTKCEHGQAWDKRSHHGGGRRVGANQT